MHRHVRGQTSVCDRRAGCGGGGAAARAWRARRPVDAAEAHVAGAGIDQPDAEIDQRRWRRPRRRPARGRPRRAPVRDRGMSAWPRTGARSGSRPAATGTDRRGAAPSQATRSNRLLTTRMASAERTKPRGTRRCSSSDSSRRAEAGGAADERHQEADGDAFERREDEVAEPSWRAARGRRNPRSSRRPARSP